MKMLSPATKSRFRQYSDSQKERLKEDRIHIRTKLRPDGVDYTTMEFCRLNDEGHMIRPSYFAYNYPMRFFERTMIGRDGTKYHVPLTDSNVELLYDTWPGKIDLDSISKKRIQSVLARSIRQEQNAKLIAEYREEFKVPFAVGNKERVEREGFALRNHQKVVRHVTIPSEAIAYFMQQGTGKTACVISSVVNWVLENNVDFAKVLIICPKNIRFNWADEIDLFCPIPHRVTLVKGTKVDRERAILHSLIQKFGERISFVVASYGALTNTQEAFCLTKLMHKELSSDLRWDWGVLDEGHYIKSSKTKRTKSALKLRDACSRRLLLTGTPYVNSLFDLWAQWEFLGKYWSGFSNFTAFREFYGEFQRREDGRRVLADFDNVPLLKERLARTSFQITKAEALPNLPEQTHTKISCDMSKEQFDLYVKVYNQLYVELENDLASIDLMSSKTKEMTVNNILTKLLRLAQITSGYVTWDKVVDDEGNEIEPQTIDWFDNIPKMEELIEYCKSVPEDEKVIIWSYFKPALKKIAARLRLEGFGTVMFHGDTKDPDRDKAVNDFNNDPKCRFFVGQPGSGGVGLNLLGYDKRKPDEYETDATRVCYYSMGWSLAQYLQSLARNHRDGTRRPIEYNYFMVMNSIDSEILSRLKAKEEVSKDLQDLRSVFGRIRCPDLGED